MITAKILKHSTTKDGSSEIITYELEYPRFIHGELMTHRLFSRNAASSRAIPVDKMMQQVLHEPAMPVEWGINKPGMQANEIHKNTFACCKAWVNAARRAVNSAVELQALGLHKQIVNRVLEPFQRMKTIITATEYDNFFYLRCHSDAQPEIRVLSELMYQAYKESTAQILNVGEWHLPYVECEPGRNGLKYFIFLDNGDKLFLTLEDARKVSSSCCAQVSYRVLDNGLEKALRIYDQLVTMKPVHASPFEHVATPMRGTASFGEGADDTVEGGITHVDHHGMYWSGNFKGWVQYRQLIPNNAVWEYNE